MWADIARDVFCALILTAWWGDLLHGVAVLRRRWRSAVTGADIPLNRPL
jgi:hypothetical protein